MEPASHLSWANLPKLNEDSTKDCLSSLSDYQSELTVSDKQGLATWFLHMIGMGLCSQREVRDALSNHYTNTALIQLYNDTHQRLVRQLDTVMSSYMPTRPTSPDANFYIEMEMPDEFDDSSYLKLTLYSGYYFNLNSVYRLPRPVFRLVMDALQLIQRLMVPCMTPHDSWHHYPLHYFDEMETEYLELRELYRNTRDDQKAFEAACECGEFWFFNYYNADSTSDALKNFERIKFGDNGYRDKTPRKLNTRHIERLMKRTKQYIKVYGEQPWLSFVLSTCSAITTYLPTNRKLNLCEPFSDYGRESEGETYLNLGIAVSCDTPSESETLDMVYHNLGETGEYPTGRIDLSRIATPALSRTLELFAVGMGLLFMADGINEDINRGRIR